MTPLGIILSEQAALFMESAACSTWRGAVEKVRQSMLVSTMASWLAAVHGHLPCGRGNTKRKKKTQDLKVACWNVRSMLYKDNSSRPERRTAHTVHELSHLDIDIAALSEVHTAVGAAIKTLSPVSTSFVLGNHPLLDVCLV